MYADEIMDTHLLLISIEWLTAIILKKSLC